MYHRAAELSGNEWIDVVLKITYSVRMHMQMSEADMRDVLAKGWYGHLGCILQNGQPYVLPIAYAYKDRHVFCFAFEGQKTDAMRKNTRVCLQVEKILTETSWKSVIVFGLYEELTGEKEKGDAMGLIVQKLWDSGNQEKPFYVPFRDSVNAMERAMADEGVVLFRINVNNMTGRVEQYEQ